MNYSLHKKGQGWLVEINTMFNCKAVTMYAMAINTDDAMDFIQLVAAITNADEIAQVETADWP